MFVEPICLETFSWDIYTLRDINYEYLELRIQYCCISLPVPLRISIRRESENKFSPCQIVGDDRPVLSYVVHILMQIRLKNQFKQKWWPLLDRIDRCFRELHKVYRRT